jgi:hypothetical protein
MNILEKYNNRFDNKEDIKFLNIIQDIARELYSGIKRKNGVDEYFNHIEDVVTNLIALNCVDKKILATAYLHDVLEENKNIKDYKHLSVFIKEKMKSYDCKNEWLEDIDVIAQNVNILSFHDEQYKGMEKTYRKAIYLKNIVQKINDDILIVKIIDRLSNVLEFYNNENKEYALKYFTRGEILYGACYERLDFYKELEELYLIMPIFQNIYEKMYSINLNYKMYFNNVIAKINEIHKYINKK